MFASPGNKDAKVTGTRLRLGCPAAHDKFGDDLIRIYQGDIPRTVLIW